MLAYLLSHSELVLSVLLGLSEVLALIFPAQTGFGGILAGLISFLKKLGAKKPESV